MTARCQTGFPNALRSPQAGGLDRGPTVIERRFGFAWGLAEWLLFHLLHRVGEEAVARLKERVIDELRTSFASHHSRVISLREALDPVMLRTYQSRSTGEKYLIDPSRT